MGWCVVVVVVVEVVVVVAIVVGWSVSTASVVVTSTTRKDIADLESTNCVHGVLYNLHKFVFSKYVMLRHSLDALHLCLQ